MSDTVPAPGAGQAPTAPLAHADLGISPFGVWAMLFLGIGVGGGLLGVLLAVAGGAGGMLIAVLLAFPWTLAMMWLGFRLLGLLLTGGGINYRRSLAAVREGRVGNSYCVRDWMGEDIVVVDEARRLLCINGEVIGFDAVKRIECASDGQKHPIRFVLVSGANPVRAVDLKGEDRAKAGFERLCNSLGFD